MGVTPVEPGVLPPLQNGKVTPQPAEVIKSILVRGIQELLVRWTGQAAADASWVELKAFRVAFPDIKLADVLLVDGGRDVMTEHQYRHRARARATTSSSSSADKL
jgi:hypothetical protein